tara:strand:- start:1229 stop:1414 length:186 start_codon:yes stop_codon:yes gene_type:complete
MNSNLFGHEFSYADRDAIITGFSLSEIICQKILSMPFHPYFEPKDADFLSDTILDNFNKKP